MKRYAWMSPLFLVSLLLVGSCSYEDDEGGSYEGERGFGSTDNNEMAELKNELKKAGIPFRESEDGVIKYQSKYDEEVNRLDKEISGGVAEEFDDENSREYFKSLLTSKQMKYRVEPRDDGEWIRWYPRDEKEQKDFEMKVVQHAFALQHGTRQDQCQGAQRPSNSTLNNDVAHNAPHAC